MYTNILAATDGSDIAVKAVDQAIGLATTLGAKLTLVTIVAQTPAFAGPEIGWTIPSSVYEEIGKANDERSQAVLAAAADKARAAGIEPQTRKLKNVDIHHGILDAAKEVGADLVVMGSHGHRGLNRLILGSEASKVLSLAEIPVLIVKP